MIEEGASVIEKTKVAAQILDNAAIPLTDRHVWFDGMWYYIDNGGMCSLCDEMNKHV